MILFDINKNKSQSNISIFHSQAGASSDPRRECENRYIVWRLSINLFFGVKKNLIN